jgi:hypothetical protein
MKKKLEAELMSIAHRVLKIKNKSDVNQLCIETRKLYEKLTLLQFVEEHFEGAKPTIGQAEVVEKMNKLFEENDLNQVVPAVTQLEIAVDVVADKKLTEEEEDNANLGLNVETDDVDIKLKPLPLEFNSELSEAQPVVDQNEPEVEKDIEFLRAFELDITSNQITTESTDKTESKQISFDELLGVDYTQTHFVRVDNTNSSPFDFELPKHANIQNEAANPLPEITSAIDLKSQMKPAMEKSAVGISIGLNDKIAFIKNLFGNSDEDYSRVMNQLITFDNFEEASSFIEDMVKPDYNFWQGKEDYEQRFIEIIEKKFS